MSGLVSVVIRRSSGAIQKMVLSTSILPFAFINPKMIAEDKTLINYIIAKYDVNNDIELERDTFFKNFVDTPELDFSGDYCSDESALAPFDYGLVVIDFINKTLHDMQWACSLEQEVVKLFKKSLSQCNDLINTKGSSLDALKDFYSLGMLKSVNFYDAIDGNLSTKKIIVNDFDLDFDDIITLIASDDTEKKRILAKKVGLLGETMYSGFNINSPIKLIEHERTCDGLMRYKNDLLSSGFNISPEEDKIWQSVFEKYATGVC